MCNANLHSQTLLLYRYTAVFNFADSTKQFIIMNLQPFGIVTLFPLTGLNSICKHEFNFPKIDID